MNNYKIGIKDAGQMNFTFNADSTFTSTVGKKTLKEPILQ